MPMDRNRPFSQLLGNRPHPRAAYEQDGVLFDGNGDEVVKSKPVATPPAATKPQTQPQSSEDADKAAEPAKAEDENAPVPDADKAAEPATNEDVTPAKTPKKGPGRPPKKDVVNGG